MPTVRLFSRRDDLRVLVIEDSAFNRKALAGMLATIPAVKAVATAVDGADGCRQALSFDPDLILLDLEMPVIDGFGFLRMRGNILREVPVIVASGRKSADDHEAAFRLGASDFIEKPTTGASMGIYSIGPELRKKIDALPFVPRPAARPAQCARPVPARRSFPAAVVIGASTGGPRSVSNIITSLPAGLSAAVVISVHMPAWLTAPFTERLSAVSRMEVRVAEDNCIVERSVVLVSPGGHRITFVRDGDKMRVRLAKAGSMDTYAPSIDEMFTSASIVWGAGVAGVVLSGMGSDGSAGAAEIKKRGGFVIAESPLSSAVASMPQAVISAKTADLVLDSTAIARWIIDACEGKKLKLA